MTLQSRTVIANFIMDQTHSYFVSTGSMQEESEFEEHWMSKIWFVLGTVKSWEAMSIDSVLNKAI